MANSYVVNDNAINDKYLADILNRIVGCLGVDCIHIKGSVSMHNFLYPGVDICDFNRIECAGVYYIECSDERDIDVIEQMLDRKDVVLIAYLHSLNMLSQKKRELWANNIHCVDIGGGYLLCFGSIFSYKSELSRKNLQRVIAVVHCYNEIDVVSETIEYLLSQGVDIYFIDNWSNDGSYDVAKDYQQKYKDSFFLERFPNDGGRSDYNWYEQLHRTEEISYKTDYDWYIHYDMDEIRIPPWKGVTIQEAISYVDYLGYNGIENTVIDFRITDKNEYIYPDGKFFDFRYKPYWINHLKTWKKTDKVDLKSTGGHRAIYKNPRIFPLRFINKHYPLRSVEQANKKVFRDRKPRFEKEKKERGWHGHYDLISCSEDMIYDRSKLYKWDDTTLDRLYFKLVMEAGIVWETSSKKWVVPEVENKRVILYGAGQAGRYAYLILARNNDVVAWVDREYEYYPYIYARKIEPVKVLGEHTKEMVIVAVINKQDQDTISKYLVDLGYRSDNILFMRDA